MGDYLATYTEEYPASDGSVDAGYVLNIEASSVKGATAYDADQAGTISRPADQPVDFLWEVYKLSSEPYTFVKTGATWARVAFIPASYDRLVGGGYESSISATELDELVAAGLLTSAERDAVTAGLT